MIAGSQLRDTQGEMLSVEGADISDLEAGKGRFNDNHGKGFFNSIGRITKAKKIFKEDDCEDDRQKYYWSQIGAPYIYVRGLLYDDEDHPNAKAAAAILRNIHKSDVPLKLRASVEGGVVARGLKDPSLLSRTKIHSIALTFTPANNATLVEPVSLGKSSDEAADMELIRSVMHLAQTNVPSFRHITRTAQASKVHNNLHKLATILNKKVRIPSKEELIQGSLEHKVLANVIKIRDITKALSAGYGGGGAPGSLVGGSVLQSEALDITPKGFKHVTCEHCGKDQIYSKHQVKCRDCKQSWSLSKIYDVMKGSKGT